MKNFQNNFNTLIIIMCISTSLIMPQKSSNDIQKDIDKRNQELQKIKEKIGKELFEKGNYDKASNIFINLCVSEKFEDFLTIPSYEHL